MDCNISIHRESEPLGDRVELKNLAVINQMQKAICPSFLSSYSLPSNAETFINSV